MVQSGLYAPKYISFDKV